MEPVFGRRQNLVAILIAGALFFTSLGFFVATNVRPPKETRAENLWVNGTGLTPSQRDVPSFTPIVEKMRGSVVRIIVTGKAQTGTTGTLPSDHPPTTSPDGSPPSTSTPQNQQNTPGTGTGTTSTTDGALPPGIPISRRISSRPRRVAVWSSARTATSSPTST